MRGERPFDARSFRQVRLETLLVRGKHLFWVHVVTSEFKIGVVVMIARLRTHSPAGEIRALYEATYFAGLRKAGMPEE